MPVSSAAKKDSRAIALGTGAVATSALALACGACCVLPLAIPALAVAWFGGLAAWLGQAHGWITTLAAVAVAGGWVRIAWQSQHSGRRQAPTSYWLMLAASVVFVTALLWPLLEPHLVRWLKG
jgi:hypothetical protein